MNPKKFTKLANDLQQPWKAPLPEFITRLYAKRFGRLMPDEVRSIEEIAARQRAKKRAKKQARKDRKAAAAGSGLCGRRAQAALSPAARAHSDRGRRATPPTSAPSFR